MNFFEAKEEAKASTARLLFAFVIGLVLFASSIAYLVVFIEYYLRTRSFLPPIVDTVIFSEAFITVILVVLIASLFQFYLLKDGGKAVALSLGGKLISPMSHNKQEITLLHIVEEMALASGIAPPPVYLLSDKGINAFAAGFTYEDAVIGITQGALDALDRQELQGVIAHEFSHIFHGDMRLNLHLTGLIYGIVFIGGIGRFIFDSLDSPSIRSSASRSSENKKGGNIIVAIYLFALGLMIIGWIGTMISEIIKAMISRQREYLADASAVQYTRYPEGIAGALKKIGASSFGSSVSSSTGGDFSHLFFSDATSNFWDHLFSTHPKLEDRIRRIDPRWDGKFTTEKISQKQYTQSKQTTFNVPNQPEAATTVMPIMFDTLSRAPNPSGSFADTAFETIPLTPEIQSMSADPLNAQWIVYALLLGSHQNELHRQKELLGNAWEKTQKSYRAFEHLPRSAHLNLLLLAVPSLRMMSVPQYHLFRKTLHALIDADKHTSIWEWALRSIVITPLDYEYGLAKIPMSIHQSPKAVRHSLNVIIFFLASTQYSDPKKIDTILKEASEHFGIESFSMVEALTIEQLDQAVQRTAQSAPEIRKQLLLEASRIIQSDGKLHEDDAEILEALKTLLHLSKF